MSANAALDITWKKQYSKCEITLHALYTALSQLTETFLKLAMKILEILLTKFKVSDKHQNNVTWRCSSVIIIKSVLS